LPSRGIIRSTKENAIMARELQPIDISDAPELLRLAEEVRSSRAPRLLRSGDQDVAILIPAEHGTAPPRGSRRRDRRTGPDDPLWKLIGLVHSESPGDVAENKDKYLADAYDLPRP
jgi:hypothetical protein